MPRQNYDDPHRHRRDVHYRLYQSHADNKPTVICVQDFDYVDYDAGRFIGLDAWETEEAAERALSQLTRILDLGRGQLAIADTDILCGAIVRLYSMPGEGFARAIPYSDAP